MFLGDEACGLFGQWLGMSVAIPALLPQTQPTWSGVEHACPHFAKLTPDKWLVAVKVALQLAR